MATKPSKPASMCCVTIGYQNFLLPADRGLRLVELMKDAVECEERFDGGRFYFVRPKQPEISMAIVRASQMRTAPPTESNHPALLLGNE